MFTKENIYATSLDAAKVSLVVGTILSFINQTHQILDFSFTKQTLLRIFLNFLVPFLVASYARYSLLFEQHQDGDDQSNKFQKDNMVDNAATEEKVDTKKNVAV